MAVTKRQWTNKDGDVSTAWIVTYRDQHGKRAAKQFDTKREADLHAASTAVAVNKGTHVSPTRSPTVREAGDAMYARIKANGMKGNGPAEPSTLEMYHTQLHLHIYPRIGDVRVGELNKPRIERFRDDLLNGMSRANAHKVWKTFKSLLKCADCAHIASGVVGIALVKRKMKLKVGVEIPSPEHIKRMLDVLDPVTELREIALVRLLAFTGPRSSEMRGLPWRDVDFKTATLSINQRSDKWGDIGPCKSRGSVRSIPIDKGTLDALKAWRLQSKFSQSNDLVFPNRLGGPCYKDRMTKWLQKVMARAHIKGFGSGDDRAVHALRHFFASWCINSKENGGRELPAKRVQELMGHSNIQETLDTYGHLFPEKSDRSALDNSVAALLG